MSGRLILVRHGQTEANVARRLDTRLPGARLTAEGIAQAEAFATTLAAERDAAALVSSEALRARQTADPAERLAGLSLQVRPGLHETQVGHLEDRSDEESHHLFAKTYSEWHTGDLKARMPGGESGGDVLDRFLPVVADLREEFLDDPELTGNVVVVSHGAAIRLVAAQLARVPGDFALTHHLANTHTVELDPIPGGGWRLVAWGAAATPIDVTDTPDTDDPMG
ncbi:histidine phosphatase family protein [Rhodococcus rhodnii]|uniref:Phosphoglycerate mutase n=2 Tax=Rhodococcus rhodnii TaxID=38312 RepID=R7WQJ4_9NOCA|nr:histidine phosphatase family protein [Rhodococcus rhodnii]EOM76244.1 phosphoglycerate mutase [Rhodococcus rhodnii LMG 5362]TXG89529.1 histidine phosphatase family protein [Rhodococcus rhodnii]